MPGGRPRTPTKVLQLRGTHRRDRHGDPATEIQFAPLTKLPRAPEAFDDVARYEWKRIGSDLIAKQLLTNADIAAFALYCINLSRVIACERIIRDEGMTMMTPGGFEMQRPEVSIARQCGAEVRKFAQEFGLTPSARTRVRVPDHKPAAAETDPWSEVAT